MSLPYTGEYNCILAGVLKQDTIFEVGNYSQFVLADFYLIKIRRLLVCRLRYRNKSYFLIFCSESAALRGGQELH